MLGNYSPKNLKEILNFEEIGPMVRNKVIYSNEDFIVMAVIGPNRRHDFHLNPKPVINLMIFIFHIHMPGVLLPD